MYFIYILRCADDTLYVGTTNDLQKRLRDHNESKHGARYTKTRRPVEMVYHEEFASKGEALSREYKIKSWPREKKLALIRGSAF